MSGAMNLARWCPRWTSFPCVLLVLGACSSSGQRPLFRDYENGTDALTRLQRAEEEIARLEQAQQSEREQAVQLTEQLRGRQQIQDTLTQRVENLRRENERLHRELNGAVMTAANHRGTNTAVTNVNSLQVQNFKLPASLATRLSDLVKRHPGATFDPVEKVCRVESAVLFLPQSDRLRPQILPLFGDLAKIFNEADARALNLLIVGHTINPPRGLQGESVARHPTAWHLGADQAIAVQQYLEEKGLGSERVGIVSYAGNQPLQEGSSEVAQRANARVEIFVYPPDPPAE